MTWFSKHGSFSLDHSECSLLKLESLECSITRSDSETVRNEERAINTGNKTKPWQMLQKCFRKYSINLKIMWWKEIRQRERVQYRVCVSHRCLALNSAPVSTCLCVLSVSVSSRSNLRRLKSSRGSERLLKRGKAWGLVPLPPLLLWLVRLLLSLPQHLRSCHSQPWTHPRLLPRPCSWKGQAATAPWTPPWPGRQCWRLFALELLQIS